MDRPLGRSPQFRRLWISNLSDETGKQFLALALTIAAVSELHASGMSIGVLSAMDTIAYLVLGIAIGVWVDRLQKRAVLIAAAVSRGIVALSIVLMHIMGVLNIQLLIFAALLLGVTAVFSDTADSAFLPLIVGREHVAEANARLQTTDSTMQVVGPGVAGLALRVLAAPMLAAVTALSSVVSLLAILGISGRERRQPRGSQEPFLASIRVGLEFVVHQPALRTFMSANVFVNFGGGIAATLTPIFALRDSQVLPTQYAIATGLGSLGGIVGSLVGLQVRRSLGELRTMYVCYIAIPVAAGVLPIAWLVGATGARTALFIVLGEFLFGLWGVVLSISSTGLRARLTPSALMGRVSAASRFVTIGSMPLGSLVGGVYLTFGPAWLGLVLATAVSTGAAIAFARSPLSSMRTAPDSWVARD